MTRQAVYTEHDRSRWVVEDPAQKRLDRHDFARDHGRIVHSAALRRLAAKTQVVEPYAGDFARNRLTHSLEVAQIGREIAGFLGCDGDLVDAACLAHDLGHPPFGHNGEQELARIAADIGGFEGNAQTLRILTRLEPKRSHRDGRPAGLNLTRAVLDATCKYPWGFGQQPQTNKFGYYPDDVEVFEWIRQGVIAERRSVEAQVMDWSDDVAYSVHDVEDAVAAGRVDLRVLASPGDLTDLAALAHQLYEPHIDTGALIEAGQQLRDSGDLPAGFDGSRAALAGLKDMTSRLIGRFVAAAQAATRGVCGRAPLARYAGQVVVPQQTRAECALLKALAAAYVMRTPGRAVAQERERIIVAELVDAFVARPRERLDADLRADWIAASSDAARLRVIVDQVASLTDTRALVLHARWVGHSD